MTVATTLGKKMMRNFYRCYILPQHIKKAKENGNTEREESLAAELKRRTKEIAAADFKDGYAEYVKAQKAKQAEWDSYVAVKSEHGKNAETTAEAQLKMLESREAFRDEYERF